MIGNGNIPLPPVRRKPPYERLRKSTRLCVLSACRFLQRQTLVPYDPTNSHRPLAHPQQLRDCPQYRFHLQGQEHRHQGDQRKELGVRYVLEGSVQRDQNRVRVNAQLIDGETGAHLRADRFE